jgi:peptidoglycan/xylan/chitin deacetylase (PgdA/CDA1 family)
LKNIKKHSLLPRWLLILGIFAASLSLISIGAYLHSENVSEDNEVSFLKEEVKTPHDSLEAGVEQAIQALPSSSSTPGSIHIPIFIYHSVRPYIKGEDALQDMYDMTPELLDEELTYLENHGYTTITMDEFETSMKNGYSPVLKPVVLTFDDGWRNQYKYAFPLLVKHHMTATFFVYTNPIDYEKPHFLSWDMVVEMDRAGMTIGDHTITHPLLPRLTPEELKRQMTLSKTILENHLGHPVRHFASPFGNTSTLIRQTAVDAGYVTARTTYSGVYHTKDDLMKLHGILVTDSITDFINTLTR